MYSRVVIKVGSKVISENDRLNEDAVARIVSELAVLRESGVEFVLVTSGAGLTGKNILTLKRPADPVVQKQIYSAVGQVGLMTLYARLFEERGYRMAQILVTKEDFRDKEHYLNLKRCFESLIGEGIIPVVNENDAIAAQAVVFTDNDELAGLIASQLDADAVVVLTSVGGVIVTNAEGSESIVPEVTLENADEIARHISASTSSSGRGGMRTKFEIGKKLMSQGIAMHIVKGAENAISESVAGAPLGTRFVPDRKLTAVKRRLSHAEGFSVGVVRVNKGAEDALRSKEKPASLLPVGVTAVEGEFRKGDIVEVVNEEGKRVGFGITKYDAGDARAAVGKKGARELIHYDYLLVV